MDKKLKILAIPGSLRKGSYNKKLLNAAIELKPDSLEIDVYELNEIPMFNSDVEKEGIPDVVENFKQKIKEADGILIAAPEYNFSITGALKNAIDWASRMPATSPMLKKPVAIMGGSAGNGGTIRAQDHLRQILSHSNMMDMKRPGVYVTKIHEKFDENGKLTDEPLKAQLQKFMSSFENWIKIFNN